MTIAQITSQNFAQIVWAKVGDQYVSVRPVGHHGQEVICDMGTRKIWVNASDLQPELNGRRVGVIGQRRDESGMPFVVKVEKEEDGSGLFDSNGTV